MLGWETVGYLARIHPVSEEVGSGHLLLGHGVGLTWENYDVKNIGSDGGELLTEHGVTDVAHGIVLEVEKGVVMRKVRGEHWVLRSHLLG